MQRNQRVVRRHALLHRLALRVRHSFAQEHVVLSVAKAHALPKLYRVRVGLRVDKDHARAVLDRAVLELARERRADALALAVGRHTQPDKVSVLPRGTLLFDRRAEAKADKLVVHFGDKAKLAVGLKEVEDFRGFPEAEHVGGRLAAKDALTHEVYLVNIVDRHLADGHVGGGAAAGNASAFADVLRHVHVLNRLAKLMTLSRTISEDGGTEAK